MSLYPEDFWSCPDCSGTAYEDKHRFWTDAPHSISYIDRCTEAGFKEKQFTPEVNKLKNELRATKTKLEELEKKLRSMGVYWQEMYE